MSEKQFFHSGLGEVLDPSRVCILETSKKKEALDIMIECLSNAPQIKDKNELRDGIYHREQLMSTGIGLGIAVPHVRLASVEDIVMCAGLCRQPITDYESLDGGPVSLMFMIAAGEKQHNQHIKLLSSISSRLKEQHLRDELINSPNEQTFYNILTKVDG